MPDPTAWPSWTFQGGAFLCRLHPGELVEDCECPPIEDWTIDPYTSGGPPPSSPAEAKRLAEAPPWP
jgi:hypothetical protein